MLGLGRTVARFAPNAFRASPKASFKPFMHKNTSFHHNHASHRTYPIRMFLYRTFLRSSSAYTLTIALLCVIGEIATNYYGDKFWRYANQGKTFEEMIQVFPEIPPNCE